MKHIERVIQNLEKEIILKGVRVSNIKNETEYLELEKNYLEKSIVEISEVIKKLKADEETK